MGDTVVRLRDGIEGLTEAADGSVAFAGIQIEDPGGTLDLDGWHRFHVLEDACSQPRIFTGYFAARNISRGRYRNGASRVWDCDVVDLNALLHLRVLRGTAAKRPQESGTARLNWLFSTAGMSGVVYDNGYVTANAWLYDATDYRGQYADDVLRDIISASGVGRWVFFLYWDNTAPAGQEISLWYNELSDAINDSTLSISNVAADVNGTTVFAPSIDATLERDPSDQYGGVYTTAQGVTPIYRTKASTIAAMGLTRDGTFTSARLNNQTTASIHTDGWLNWHSLEIDKITYSVVLPKDKVNLLAAGMRAQHKFSHLPGYESWTWLRITRRTVVLAADAPESYTVHIEASLKGVLQTGGGDPGDFPLPQACVEGTATIVQSVSGAPGGTPVSLSLPAAPTVGNTVIVYGTRRDILLDDHLEAPVGFTDSGVGDVYAHEQHGAIFYRIVQSGDTAAVSWAPAAAIIPENCYIEERRGQFSDLAAVGFTSTDPYNSGPNYNGATITPTAGRLGAIVGYSFMKRNTGNIDARAGWTEIEYALQGGVVTHAAVHQIVTSTSGSYTPAFTSATGSQVVFDDHSYGAITIALLCSAADSPPEPAQWVYGEIVTMSGSTGTTAFDFADGSLRVWVDDIDQTAALVSSNGAAGTFVLSFVPTSTEQVKVDYQGL